MDKAIYTTQHKRTFSSEKAALRWDMYRNTEYNTALAKPKTKQGGSGHNKWGEGGGRGEGVFPQTMWCFRVCQHIR